MKREREHDRGKGAINWNALGESRVRLSDLRTRGSFGDNLLSFIACRGKDIACSSSSSTAILPHHFTQVMCFKSNYAVEHHSADGKGTFTFGTQAAGSRPLMKKGCLTVLSRSFFALFTFSGNIIYYIDCHTAWSFCA